MIQSQGEDGFSALKNPNFHFEKNFECFKSAYFILSAILCKDKSLKWDT